MHASTYDLRSTFKSAILCSDLTEADYQPDHNTRLASLWPIPPSPDPGLPSHPALAFLGEKE